MITKMFEFEMTVKRRILHLIFLVELVGIYKILLVGMLLWWSVAQMCWTVMHVLFNKEFVFGLDFYLQLEIMRFVTVVVLH